MKQKKLKKKRISRPQRPVHPSMTLSTEDKIRFLANIIVDRIIEEEQLYKEKLKTDPNAKRIYETCECNKCRKKRINSAIAKGKLTCSRFRSK